MTYAANVDDAHDSHPQAPPIPRVQATRKGELISGLKEESINLPVSSTITQHTFL